MCAKSVAAAILVVTAALLPVGCSRAVHGYLLSRQGGTEVLIPPGVKLPAKGALEVTLPHARKAPFPQTGCEIDRDPIVMQWRGDAAYIRVQPDSALLGFGEGSLGQQRLSLDPLQYINEFRGDLVALESNGCLHPGGSQALAAQIAERLPFPPFIAYLLRFGVFDLNQFIDLTPDFRLRVVYPVYSEESGSQTKEIKGVETVFYKIVSDQKDGRVRISQTPHRDSSQDSVATEKLAKQIASPFPRSFAYYRLFLKKGISSKEPVTLAIVLSSEDRKHLDDATKQLNSDTEASCRTIVSSSATCVIFPPLTGMNAEIRVKANGKDAYAEIGARVDQLIHELGSDDIPRSVQVRRLFDKRLVPIRVDADEKAIAALILMPGDVVSYR